MTVQIFGVDGGGGGGGVQDTVCTVIVSHECSTHGHRESDITLL